MLSETVQKCAWYNLSSGKQSYCKPKWGTWPVSLIWVFCFCIQFHSETSAVFSYCLHSPVIGVWRSRNEGESALPGLPSSLSAPSFLKSFYPGSGRLLQHSENDLSKRWERRLLPGSAVPLARDSGSPAQRGTHDLSHTASRCCLSNRLTYVMQMSERAFGQKGLLIIEACLLTSSSCVLLLLQCCKTAA